MYGWLQRGPWAKSVLAQHANVCVPTCICTQSQTFHNRVTKVLEGR